MHLFKEHYKEYIDKGLSVIPDKFMMKQPAIKAWTDFCHKLPTSDEIQSWISNLDASNIAVCMGEASGIIALDIDETREEVLREITPLLPSSPVIKIGAKGLTYFFKYTNEVTQAVKFNGETVCEILSNGKKCTVAPSIHPNGSAYQWQGKSLLDVDLKQLPLLPPFLLSTIEQKLKLRFPDLTNSGTRGMVSGRNNELSSLCGKLIQEQVPVDEAIKQLIEFDEQTNKPPLFTDPSEMRHTEAFTNALTFYSNHLSSVNVKRFRESKEYEIPITASAVNHELAKEVTGKKSQRQGNPKKLSLELPHVSGVIEKIQSNILQNSWIQQPNFAFSASLVLMSTLLSRKFVFQGMSPNLYVLNVAPSGAGKDAPQQILKRILIEIGAESLLGAGDYVSDASLTDSLEVRPTRLDIMDEAGGVLKTVNKGRSEYNGKMADILAELYTTSNNKYLGRATAEGTKGSCFRPNVNILASTTPTGLSEGMSIRAIEKGLMGRFLIYIGSGNERAKRLKDFPMLDNHTLNALKYWYSFNPEPNPKYKLNGISQAVTELKATPEAEKRLDEAFEWFDNLRTESNSTDPLLPIIARLYQMLVKVTMIHACSRSYMKIPVIDAMDVEFGHNTIKYHLETMREIVDRYIFNNENDMQIKTVLEIISSHEEGLDKRQLYNKTRGLKKRERDDILNELVDSGDIMVDRIDGKLVYMPVLNKEHY